VGRVWSSRSFRAPGIFPPIVGGTVRRVPSIGIARIAAPGSRRYGRSLTESTTPRSTKA
jgi:hypothetical protein